MATNITTTTTTTTDNNQPDVTAPTAAARTVSNNATTVMQNFAAGQAARATRLTAVLNRLKKSSQTPPGVLQKLTQSITASNAVAQEMGSLAQRIAQRPTVDPADIVIYGRVLPAAGAKLPPVWVQLTDSAGRLAIGSRVQVAASGDFTLSFATCQIPAGEAGFVVAAENSQGVRLAVSAAVTLIAGSPAYIELTLPATKA
jgi:hypothetical protein